MTEVTQSASSDTVAKPESGFAASADAKETDKALRGKVRDRTEGKALARHSSSAKPSKRRGGGSAENAQVLVRLSVGRLQSIAERVNRNLGLGLEVFWSGSQGSINGGSLSPMWRRGNGVGCSQLFSK